MDRQLTAEFPPFIIDSDKADPASWVLQASDTRVLSATTFVQEMKLDLSGYVKDSLTIGFRRSFEQEGGSDFMFWESFDANNDALIENTIVSSVPFNDAQLGLALAIAPGFTVPYIAGADFGNFNREHIIHGRYQLMYPNSTIGAGAFTAPGNAALMSVTDTSYSSLEPTAADCLYCYRILSLPRPGFEAGVTKVSLPPKRIILDAFTVEEPELEYLMRLKRSYELANQV